MGLTWIDHDTIEQPIEEISKKTAEAGGGKGNLDIEFKVDEAAPPFPRRTGRWWLGCKNP